MEQASPISATTDNLEDHFDLLECYLSSANILRATAIDGISKNISGSIGLTTNEVWNGNLITSFFLYRHSLELAVKALIKELQGIEVNGHNIKKLWEDNIPDHQNFLYIEINSAFKVLEEYDVLKDAQLFRYHKDKAGTKLKAMRPIQNADFDAISCAVWAIRQAILENIHVVKKKLP